MLYIYLEQLYFDEIADELLSVLAGSGISVLKTSQVYPENDDDLYIMFGMNDFNGQYLPKNYIVYQLEQSTGDAESKWFNERYMEYMRNALETWEYSLINYSYLKGQGIRNIVYIPLTYMSTCNRHFPKDTVKDIDVLFYGSMNDRRRDIIAQLENSGITVTKSHSLWGSERDNMIARSRVILNIHFYDRSILETARLSYLLSNGCRIISEKSIDPVLDRDHSKYIDMVDKDQLVKHVKHCLDTYDEPLVQNQHQTSYEKYKKHPYSTHIPFTQIKDKYAQLLRYKNSPIDENDVKLRIRSNDDSDIFHPKQSVGPSGEVILKLPKYSDEQLPMVSIVTITRNRQQLFQLPIRNWNLFEYPRDKLEWIIVDDSDSDSDLSKILPESKQIHYHHLSEHKSIGYKRNYGISQASGEYIAFMDDDDYYYPLSIYARIALLLAYPQYKLVGVTRLDIYDVVNDFSARTNSPYISEASMAFHKSFWQEQKFPETQPRLGEGYLFTINRRHRLMTMPSCFNLIAMTHWTNYTHDNRSNTRLKLSRGDSILKVLDFTTKLFLFNLFDKIRKKIQIGA